MYKGIDINKDQSYFLYGLNQNQIKNTIFPLGGINKLKVRNYAKKLGFNNYNKKDSTGICFIGKRNFKEFLKKYIPANPGDIITSNNEKELPEAFLRRCFFHYIQFPDFETLKKIIKVHFPEIKKTLLESALKNFFDIFCFTKDYLIFFKFK